MSDNSHGGYVFYHYTPSVAAAGIFVALFAITTALHGTQMIRKRAWFMIPFFIGGLFETIGYVGRALSSKDTQKLGPYIIQSVLLLVAPALFAASIYMILGRIILLVDGEEYSMIRKKWLTKIFVAGDVLSFFVQSGGAGIMAKSEGNGREMGPKIILGGLGIQIVIFGLFMVVAAVFHKRMLKYRRSFPSSQPSSFHSMPSLDVPWQKYMWSLYGASLLILVRSIFRFIEYAQGNDGYLLQKEVFLYVFDSILMLGVMVWMNWIHPGDILSGKRRAASGQSAMEMVREG